MQLLIDAGNTRIKWALIDPAHPNAAWITSGTVLHAEITTLTAAWQCLPIAAALASNVAGPRIAAALQAALPSKVELRWFVSSAAQAGVMNGYREPTQLGCDRFASLIGAAGLFPQRALIVATCGTATTIDALTADGRFIGGMILPGLGLMATSLARETAQLPQIAADLQAESPFAVFTEAAIASGCLAAQAGAIERAVARHALAGPVHCVLSGGAAALIRPQLSIPVETVDNLVLLGLQRFVCTG